MTQNKSIEDEMQRLDFKYDHLNASKKICNSDCSEEYDIEEMREEYLSLVKKSKEERDLYWVEHLEAHRPHCSQLGNLAITDALGKENRNVGIVKKIREEERERIKSIVWDILSEYDTEVESIREEFDKALSNTPTT